MSNELKCRVIVHAGFHKTGTSSLQKFLSVNKQLLSPYAAIYLKQDFLRVGFLSRKYASTGFPWRRWQFRIALRRFLRTIPADAVIILSWEGFCGVMPGHRKIGGGKIVGYSRVSIPLAKDIVKELRRRFGANTEVELLYTVRSQESWIKSVYGHLVRSIRITDSFEDFCNSFEILPELNKEASAIAKAVSEAHITTAIVEKYWQFPFGTGNIILERLSLPNEVLKKLRSPAAQNVGFPPEYVKKFLDLNIAISDKSILAKTKRKLVEAYNSEKR